MVTRDKNIIGHHAQSQETIVFSTRDDTLGAAKMLGCRVSGNCDANFVDTEKP